MPANPHQIMNDHFATTRWTLVRHATGHSAEGRRALSDLCAAYYEPVVAYLRKSGRDDDAARDLAHGFFEYLLATPNLAGAEPGRGRFRNYLLGALKHFVLRAHEWSSREKRGGGAQTVSLDEGTDTSPGIVVADANALAPDAFFDRQWALALIERAIVALEKEHADAGKARDFSLLKPWLTGDAVRGGQAGVAQELGMSDGALKVAIHRLRRRFRDLVKSEVAQTIDSQDGVADEMEHLFAALSGG